MIVIYFVLNWLLLVGFALVKSWYLANWFVWFACLLIDFDCLGVRFVVC